MIQIHENRQRRRRGAHSAKGEASNAPHLAEAVEHRGDDDMVHHRRVRLRKCEAAVEVGRKRHVPQYPHLPCG